MDEILSKKFLKMAAKVAEKSSCQRRFCGSVIVKRVNGKWVVLGKGYNSPVGNLEPQRRCIAGKNEYNKKVTDKTCCVHAEVRAIHDAMKKFGNGIKGSTLFFTAIDKDKNILFSSKAYCTICSKAALDVGIKYFVLNHKDGLKFYNTEEYNNLSYSYSE